MSLSNVSTEISCDLQLHPQSISGNGMGSLGMNRFYWKLIILGMASCYHSTKGVLIYARIFLILVLPSHLLVIHMQ